MKHNTSVFKSNQHQHTFCFLFSELRGVFLTSENETRSWQEVAGVLQGLFQPKSREQSVWADWNFWAVLNSFSQEATAVYSTALYPVLKQPSKATQGFWARILRDYPLPSLLNGWNTLIVYILTSTNHPAVFNFSTCMVQIYTVWVYKCEFPYIVHWLVIDFAKLVHSAKIYKEISYYKQ